MAASFCGQRWVALTFSSRLAEIDVITPKRETAQREMERRIVAQLLTSMDDLQMSLPVGSPPVLILGATNRADAIDPAIRRAGRFDREFALNVPGLAAREQILRVLCAPLRLDDDVDYLALARNTPGYVGADLKSLVSEAGLLAMSRAFHVLEQEHEALEASGEPEAADNHDEATAMAVDGEGESTPPATPAAAAAASSTAAEQDGPAASGVDAGNVDSRAEHLRLLRYAREGGKAGDNLGWTEKLCISDAAAASASLRRKSWLT